MLTEELKAKIEALSLEELQHEVNLGRRSRFQGEKFAYLKTRISTLQSADAAQDKEARRVQEARVFRLNSISTWVAVFTSVLSLVVGSGWLGEYHKGRKVQAEASQRLVADYLVPVKSLLELNAAIYAELRSPRYLEPPMGILESYLLKIRRDGVQRHALMKQRIDTLVTNNQEMVTLLLKYEPYAIGNSLKKQSAAFQHHAVLYGDRWKSLLEIYVANGQFPADAAPFPTEFPAAVEAELGLRRAAEP